MSTSLFSKASTPASAHAGAVRWVLSFLGLNAFLLAFVLAMAWVYGAFDGPGLSGHLLIALCLGVTVTSGLGVGLMALSFYSARDHFDEDAFHIGRDGKV